MLFPEGGDLIDIGDVLDIFYQPAVVETDEELEMFIFHGVVVPDAIFFAALGFFGQESLEVLIRIELIAPVHAAVKASEAPARD